MNKYLEPTGDPSTLAIMLVIGAFIFFLFNQPKGPKS